MRRIKFALAGAGFILAGLGVMLEYHALTRAAIAVLSIALVLGVIERVRSRASPEESGAD